MAVKKVTKLDFLPDVDFKDILTNPILDIAARFWDSDRYEAFRVCYRSMRRIDDLVDHRKESSESISAGEARQLDRMMSEWLMALKARDISDPFRHELIDIIDRFKIPFWPWERLYKSMAYDLEHDGFSSMITFLRYSEGAAIAPASIFMHLCGVSPVNDGYREPAFNIRSAARHLAVFSYLVHIIRDFQKDHLAGLNYFADNILIRYNLTREDLYSIANGGHIPQSFRELMAFYFLIAGYYRKKARRTLDNIIPILKPRYQLSMEMIYSLYLQIYERINPEAGTFSSEELNPRQEEVQQRIDRTIDNFIPPTD